MGAHHQAETHSTAKDAIKDLKDAHTAALVAINTHAKPGDASAHAQAISDLKTHLNTLNTLTSSHINDHTSIPDGHLKQQLAQQHDHVVKALTAHVKHLEHHEATHVPNM